MGVRRRPLNGVSQPKKDQESGLFPALRLQVGQRFEAEGVMSAFDPKQTSGDASSVRQERARYINHIRVNAKLVYETRST